MGGGFEAGMVVLDGVLADSFSVLPVVSTATEAEYDAADPCLVVDDDGVDSEEVWVALAAVEALGVDFATLAALETVWAKVDIVDAVGPSSRLHDST